MRGVAAGSFGDDASRAALANIVTTPPHTRDRDTVHLVAERHYCIDRTRPWRFKTADTETLEVRLG